MKLISAKEALIQSKLNRVGYIQKRISEAIQRGKKYCYAGDLTKGELAQLKEQGYKVIRPNTFIHKISWEL